MLITNLTPHKETRKFEKYITTSLLEQLNKDFLFKTLRDFCRVGDYVIITDGSYSTISTNNMLFDTCGLDFIQDNMHILFKIIGINGDYPTTCNVPQDTAIPYNNIELINEFGDKIYTNNRMVCRLKEEQVPHHLRFTK